jgi:hypothetical protein
MTLLHRNTKPAASVNCAVLLNNICFVLNMANLDISASIDSLCGLVARVPDYRSRGPGSIPDGTRLTGSGTGSTQPREYN